MASYPVLVGGCVNLSWLVLLYDGLPGYATLCVTPTANLCHVVLADDGDAGFATLW